MANKQTWRKAKRGSSKPKSPQKNTQTKKQQTSTTKSSKNSPKTANSAGKGKQKNKKKKKRKWLKIVIITLIALFLLGSAAVAGLFVYYAQDLPSPDKINKRDVSESSKIYDRDEKEVLYEIHGEEKRTVVKIDDISDHIINATLAAEDQQFYNHFGFNPKGIARSLFQNTTSGSKVGGSTITQQFVKNSILTSEKTYTRKIKELILAVQIEAKFSKEEILQMYLNEISYGSNAYGIEAASQTFFNKSAKDVTIAEAATLAALPNAPSYYSPYGSNTDDLKIRTDWIISEMVANGYITQEEGDAAMAEEVVYREIDQGIIAAHFVMYIREILEENYSEEIIKGGGLKIVSTLDLDLQRLAERVVPEGVSANQQYNASNAALVAVDPTSGHILAMQGSKDYFDRENDGNVNVTIAERQPGSSFKPFAYANAFQKGYTTETILFDVFTDFGNNYRPQNYDLQTQGPITMRRALQGSLNIPAVKTLYLAGLEDTIQFVEKLGITTLGDRSRFGLSLVLGGGEVKLLEETAAYGVFANEGKRNKTTPILKIVDRDGNVLEDNTNPEGEQVMEAKAAKMINSVLSDTGARRSMLGGLASTLELPDRQVAAKTGTTQNFRDALTVGYTPNLAVGVWAGNNNGAEMKSGAAGIYVAAPIWKSFMVEATKNRENKDFSPMEPDNVDKPILRGQVMPETKVKVHKISGKLATPLTPPDLVEEKTYRTVHNILHYVDKNNPRGPIPSNPRADEQYNSWEGAVQGWAEKQGYISEEPPTENDDSNNEANQPAINITSPQNSETITSNSVTIKTNASAGLGIKKVDFIIDGTVIKSDDSFPYEATLDLTSVSNGFHNFTAKIHDLAGNTADSTIALNVKLAENAAPTTISLVNPQNGITAVPANFPLIIKANVGGSLPIDKVEFFINNQVVERLSGSGNNKAYSINWNGPVDPGTYTIKAAAVDSEGVGVFSNSITVTVE